MDPLAAYIKYEDLLDSMSDMSFNKPRRSTMLNP